MVAYAPRVFALSQMNYAGEAYYQVLMPQSETTEEMFAQFMYISQDEVLLGFQIEFKKILASPQGAMKDLFIDLADLLND